MLSYIAKILGSDKVITKGLDLIDDLWTTSEEERESKAKAKIDLLKAYAPYKLAQRYLALMFTFVFLFIMINGILGALYGVIEMGNVINARDFANDMWLGEIMMMIVAWYFGGGVVNEAKKKRD